MDTYSLQAFSRCLREEGRKEGGVCLRQVQLWAESAVTWDYDCSICVREDEVVWVRAAAVVLHIHVSQLLLASY